MTSASNSEILPALILAHDRGCGCAARADGACGAVAMSEPVFCARCIAVLIGDEGGTCETCLEVVCSDHAVRQDDGAVLCLEHATGCAR